MMDLPPNMSRPQPSLQRRSSSRSLVKQEEEHDLTQTLHKLTLDISMTPSKTTGLSPKTSANPLKPSSRRSSPSPARQKLSRSPSAGPERRDSTPNLLRKASMNSLHSANGIGTTQSSSRRSSFANVKPPIMGRSVLGEDRPLLTAEGLARACFEAELETHHGPVATLPTDLVVFLNDAVYGHRFARPRTTRAALSTIVERPERIKAGVLGISAAYIRLGGRYSDGTIPPHPRRDIHRIPSIPFRIQKTSRRLPLLSDAVTLVHGQKWMAEMKTMCEKAEERLAMGQKELQRPTRTSRSPDEPRPEKLHEGDLYLCAESLQAVEGALGAVCEAIDVVFGSGPRRAFVAVRPPGHHCSASHPSGFCWVNNVHVGIMHAVLQHGVTHAAIIDFDLHHGDGSQDITWNHNSRAITANKNAPPWKKASIGYFSIHDINSYPCEQGDVDKVKNASLCIDNAHGQSIWNVHLESWKNEQEFWELYESKYVILIKKTRDYLRNQAERLRAAGQIPKAVIFFSAGFDASEWEGAGMQRHQVNVPTEFYARLAQDVTRLSAEEGLYVEGRIISVLEGGYSDRALCSGIMSHISGLVGGQPPEKGFHETSGLGLDMSHTMGIIHDEQQVTLDEPTSAFAHAYDPSWWAPTELEKLEALVAPKVPPPSKPRKSGPPTYTSATTASAAKIVEPAKIRRSFSGSSSRMSSRPPSPPPPEVPWTTAAHEFSKLLIPANRQTDSHQAEELGAEASKLRKEKISASFGRTAIRTPQKVEQPSTPRTGLRERKAKPTTISGTASQELGGQNRRRTYGVGDQPPSRGTTPVATPIRRTSRRLSGVSTILDTAEESPSHEEAPGRNNLAQQSRPTVAARAVSESTLENSRKAPLASSSARKSNLSGSGKGNRSVSSTGTSPSVTKTKQKSAAQSSPAGTDDMDQLTKGMKRIKINLVTQSQKDAREKARSEAALNQQSPIGDKESISVAPSATASTPIPEDESMPGSLGNFHSESVSPLQSESLGAISALSTNRSPAFGAPATPVRDMTAEFQTPYQDQTPNSSIAAHSDFADEQESSVVFIPYQPNGPAPTAMSQQEPLTWMAPNAPPSHANTPVTVTGPPKSDLYHHTPGGIPFAPRVPNATSKLGSDNQSNNTTNGKTHSLQAIPETPSKQK